MMKSLNLWWGRWRSRAVLLVSPTCQPFYGDFKKIGQKTGKMGKVIIREHTGLLHSGLICLRKHSQLLWVSAAASEDLSSQPGPETWAFKGNMKVLVAQSCLTLYDPMDYSLLGSSVHGILQARILPFPFLGYLPDPGIEPRSFALEADSLPS